jgi:hypothetical protein
VASASIAFSKNFNVKDWAMAGAVGFASGLAAGGAGAVLGAFAGTGAGAASTVLQQLTANLVKGALFGLGFDAIHWAAENIDKNGVDFSKWDAYSAGRAVNAMVMGAALGGLSTIPGVGQVVGVGLLAMGTASAVKELQEGNYFSGGFDLSASMFAFNELVKGGPRVAINESIGEVAVGAEPARAPQIIEEPLPLAETGPNAAAELVAEPMGQAALEREPVALCEEGANCFAAGHLFDTPSGPVAIERLRESDEVLARSEYDPDGPIEPRRIEAIFVRTGNVFHLHVGGQVVRTTREHPFRTRHRGWVQAAKLITGEELATRAGGWVIVEDQYDTGEPETLYNIRVTEYHTYFVTGPAWSFSIWAHNACTVAEIQAAVQQAGGEALPPEVAQRIAETLNGKSPNKAQQAVQILEENGVEIQGDSIQTLLEKYGATTAEAVLGGQYKDARTTNTGGEVHHIPSYDSLVQAYGAENVPYEEMPGIWMETLDHYQTGSRGSGPDAVEFREIEAGLLEQGDVAGAIQMNIDDVRNSFPNGKYEQNIQQYLQSLPPNLRSKVS